MLELLSASPQVASYGRLLHGQTCSGERRKQTRRLKCAFLVQPIVLRDSEFHRLYGPEDAPSEGSQEAVQRDGLSSVLLCAHLCQLAQTISVLTQQRTTMCQNVAQHTLLHDPFQLRFEHQRFRRRQCVSAALTDCWRKSRAGCLSSASSPLAFRSRYFRVSRGGGEGHWHTRAFEGKEPLDALIPGRLDFLIFVSFLVAWNVSTTR